MTLKTWAFSKKKNSTAQPATASRDYTVYMKENTSIENPVFILGTGIDSGISYCQAFGNYYFIDDIVMLTADQCELHCSIDVLATHKTAIGNYTGFVERAAASHNAYIIDTALSATQNIVSETMATTDIFDADQDGCFVVRVVCPSSDSPTGIASFVMSHRELNALLDFIVTDSSFPDVLTDSIVKSFFNPFQYIISIMWFPMSRNDIPGSDEDLILGWWDVPYPTTPGSTSFKMLNSAAGYYDNVSLSMPTSYYSDDFRKHVKNFTQLSAYIPGLGMVDLDPEFLSASNPTAEVSVDFVTGSMLVNFYDRGSQGGVTVNKSNFGSFSGQIGIPIQCGQWSGMGSSVVAAGGASGGSVAKNFLSDLGQSIVAAGADVLSGIGGAVKGILNVGSSNQNVYGSSGNMAQVVAHPELILYQRAYGCGEFPNTVFGRPLCAVRQISTLSGYIKMQAASIALDAPDTEIEKVNNYLNTGFYYE